MTSNMAVHNSLHNLSIAKERRKTIDLFPSSYSSDSDGSKQVRRKHDIEDAPKNNNHDGGHHGKQGHPGSHSVIPSPKCLIRYPTTRLLLHTTLWPVRLSPPHIRHSLPPPNERGSPLAYPNRQAPGERALRALDLAYHKHREILDRLEQGIKVYVVKELL